MLPPDGWQVEAELDRPATSNKPVRRTRIVSRQVLRPITHTIGQKDDDNDGNGGTDEIETHRYCFCEAAPLPRLRNFQPGAVTAWTRRRSFCSIGPVKKVKSVGRRSAKSGKVAPKNLSEYFETISYRIPAFEDKTGVLL